MASNINDGINKDYPRDKITIPFRDNFNVIKQTLPMLKAKKLYKVVRLN